MALIQAQAACSAFFIEATLTFRKEKLFDEQLKLFQGVCVISYSFLLVLLICALITSNTSQLSWTVNL